jgi:hypothetical protein
MESGADLNLPIPADSRGPRVVIYVLLYDPPAEPFLPVLRESKDVLAEPKAF